MLRSDADDYVEGIYPMTQKTRKEALERASDVSSSYPDRMYEAGQSSQPICPICGFLVDPHEKKDHDTRKQGEKEDRGGQIRACAGLAALRRCR